VGQCSNFSRPCFAPETTHTCTVCCSTAARFYLVGRSKAGPGRSWVVLTLVRGSPTKGSALPSLEAHETTSALSQQECAALLRQIHAGNSGSSSGGLQLVCKVSTAEFSALVLACVEALSLPSRHAGKLHRDHPWGQSHALRPSVIKCIGADKKERGFLVRSSHRRVQLSCASLQQWERQSLANL